MSRLTDFRDNFATLCAKADRKLETQRREARRVSALHGHGTRHLKLSTTKTQSRKSHETR